MRGLALLSLVLACRIPDEHFVGGDAAVTPDGSAGIDAAIDAAPDAGIDAGSAVCDDTTAFGSAITTVSGLPVMASVARFSPNELTAYFGLVGSGSGGHVDLFQATRTSLSAPFGGATLLASLVGGSGETTPYVSPDGLDIVYTHGDSGAGTKDIWHASRALVGDAFSSPAEVANANGSGVEDDYSSIAPNGDLWFSSKRGSDLALEIYLAPSSGSATWGSASSVTVLDSGGSAGSYYPVLTQDQLHIYFARLETGTIPFTIYEASRANAADSFSAPKQLASLPTGSDIRAAWISPDDCRLYVGFGSAGAITMGVATRP